MKIQKIIDICKKSGELYITDVDGIQWVGNGYAVYPLVGLPKFTPESLCDTFGVSEDAQSKMILNERQLNDWGGIDFGDIRGDEAAAEVLPIEVYYKGRVLVCVKCDGSVYFINGRYLNPYKEAFELYKRNFGPMEYFVIAQGFMVEGIVFPEVEYRPQLVGELRDLVKIL